MIQNVIFDVGMVLVNFAWERVMRNLGIAGEDFDAVADATVRNSLWGEHDSGRMSDEEVLAAFIAENPSQEKNIRLFWEHIGDTIQCFPYTHDWVRSCKEKGLGCYILSNYSKRTYELTKEELSFEKLMDGVLFSYQVKMVKPEPGIFREFLTRFSLRPEECIFFDDSSRNVEAAKAEGIHAFLFTTQEDAQKELERLI